MTHTFSEIERIIEVFFENLSEGKPFNGDVFYQKAMVLEIEAGRVKRTPIEKWRRNNVASPIGVKSYQLINIDVTKNSMACAKFRYQEKAGERNGLFLFVREERGWLIVHGLLGAVGELYSSWFETLTEQIAVHRQIEEVVKRYAEGVFLLDSDCALEEFQTETRMIHADEDNRISDVPIQALRQRWEKEASAKELGIPLFAHFEGLEMLGPDTALVKIFDSKRWNGYFDYLSLGKEKDRWKIINKVTILPLEIPVIF